MDPQTFYEQLAVCDEGLLEAYLSENRISDWDIRRAVRERKVFPATSDRPSHLKGVECFLHGIVQYAAIRHYPKEFGAKIFKISRDEQGTRLTHLKITGGSLRVRDVLTNGEWEEKVNQIRVYSGSKYEVVSEIVQALSVQ